MDQVHYLLRAALLLFLLPFWVAQPRFVRAQGSAPQAGTAPAEQQKALDAALAGEWTGTLEYRDYSEPAGSTKRVKLPTWLSIAEEGGGLRFRYIYDDGPGKTVTDSEQVAIDVGAARYSVTPAGGKNQESYAISGLEQLKQGRGTITLNGSGIESNAPTQVRLTIHIGRNLLEILRETASPGQPLAFRHAYTFVRSAAPAVQPSPPTGAH